MGERMIKDNWETALQHIKASPYEVKQKTTEAGPLADNTTKWKAVSAGEFHTVAIDRDGTLWSWGGAGNGQLGDGTKIDKSSPVRVQQAGITWKAVSAGGTHTVGIAEDGTLWSWGDNDNGQLGDGTKGETTNKSTPARTYQTETAWKAVSAGGTHTVGIDSDGNIWSWGDNDKGQLGDGTKEDKSTPVKIQIPK